jgi:hypothetical protein
MGERDRITLEQDRITWEQDRIALEQDRMVLKVPRWASLSYPGHRGRSQRPSLACGS